MEGSNIDDLLGRSLFLSQAILSLISLLEGELSQKVCSRVLSDLDQFSDGLKKKMPTTDPAVVALDRSIAHLRQEADKQCLL